MINLAKKTPLTHQCHFQVEFYHRASSVNLLQRKKGHKQHYISYHKDSSEK